MKILDQWDLRIAVDDILRAQGGDPTIIRSRSPHLVQVARSVLEEGKEYIHPKAAYRILEVDNFQNNCLRFKGGGALCGKLIKKILGNVEYVSVIGCTIGEQLENIASQRMVSDPVYGFALHGMGIASLEALANAVCSYFENFAQGNRMHATMYLNPGMEGWTLAEGQKQIFNLADFSAIGLELKPSTVLHPLKSLTMVIGMGSESTKKGSPCDFCPKRDTCQYRSV